MCQILRCDADTGAGPPHRADADLNPVFPVQACCEPSLSWSMDSAETTTGTSIERNAMVNSRKAEQIIESKARCIGVSSLKRVRVRDDPWVIARCPP